MHSKVVCGMDYSHALNTCPKQLPPGATGLAYRCGMHMVRKACLMQLMLYRLGSSEGQKGCRVCQIGSFGTKCSSRLWCTWMTGSCSTQGAALKLHNAATLKLYIPDSWMSASVMCCCQVCQLSWCTPSQYQRACYQIRDVHACAWTRFASMARLGQEAS